MEISELNGKIDIAEANISDPPPDTDASYWLGKVSQLNAQIISKLGQKNITSIEVETLKEEKRKLEKSIVQFKLGIL